MHKKIIEKANKLMEMSMPLLEKFTDDTMDNVPEKAIDACIKMVELSHYLYEVAAMQQKLQMHSHDGMYEEEKEYDNPKPRR